MILGGRYFKLSNAVFCYGLKPIKLAVYSYLVSCAGQREKCWPAMKTIAACCGCSKNAARDAVTELVKRGFIRKVETFKDESNGKTRQTIYGHGRRSCLRGRRRTAARHENSIVRSYDDDSDTKHREDCKQSNRCFLCSL